VPNVLTQMLPAFRTTTMVALKTAHGGAGIRGGLAAMGVRCSDISISPREHTLLVQVRIEGKVNAETEVPMGPIFLQLTTEGELPLPLKYHETGIIDGQFSYSKDGHQFTPLGDRFNLHPGRWIGARLGLFCMPLSNTTTNHLIFDEVKQTSASP